MGGVAVYIYSGGWSVTTPEIILTRMTSNDFELTMITVGFLRTNRTDRRTVDMSHVTIRVLLSHDQ